VIDKGENFNNCAILDDFVMGEILGTGGFGKVLLATDKLKKRKVAVKFIDVSEQRK
jgi:serine/threonine protein kinase